MDVSNRCMYVLVLTIESEGKKGNKECIDEDKTTTKYHHYQWITPTIPLSMLGHGDGHAKSLCRIPSIRIDGFPS